MKFWKFEWKNPQRALRKKAKQSKLRFSVWAQQPPFSPRVSLILPRHGAHMNTRREMRSRLRRAKGRRIWVLQRRRRGRRRSSSHLMRARCRTLWWAGEGLVSFFRVIRLGCSRAHCCCCCCNHKAFVNLCLASSQLSYRLFQTYSLVLLEWKKLAERRVLKKFTKFRESSSGTWALGNLLDI